MTDTKDWEYASWPLYDVCQGCGAAYSSMHADDCPRPGRKDIEVIAIDALPDMTIEEALDAAAEALTALSCPYYMTTFDIEREGRFGIGTCGGDCYDEPKCCASRPGLWTGQLLEAARVLDRLCGEFDR